ncbi:uncharacterized protein [Drosophila kikkawai]|uniref:Uncharacterized protein isoform X1 n=1 Tax=Drosophila kikkawai TaxID=30033 RepID=A0ABM4GJF4_DROKI
MLVSQIPLGLLFLLLRGCVGAPLNGPCGDHEQRACLPCHEPTCSHPFVSEPNCRFLYLCHLGCGCSFGFLRDDDTNRCVPNHQCDTSQRPLPLQPPFRK